MGEFSGARTAEFWEFWYDEKSFKTMVNGLFVM
jgi:hypothetical protein